MAADTLQVDLLGELRVRRGSRTVRLPQSKKTRALLGYLIVSRRPQRRARLCSLFWDVADDPRGALRWCLSKIRPVVNEPGHTRIVTDRDSVSFDASSVEVDVFRSREAIQSGVEATDTDTLIEIAESYRGELLEGLEMSDFDEFQAWCLAERSEARALRARVLRELCARLTDEPERALPHARNLIRIAPIDQDARAQLIELLMRAGRTEDAQLQFEASIRQLREFGVEPSTSLTDPRHLATRTHSDNHSTTATSPPSNTPPLGSSTSGLVGRRSECERFVSIITSVHSEQRQQIVALTGEPGVGKSRLVDELLANVQSRGGTTTTARAYEAERGRPFGPWIDALRTLPSIGSKTEHPALAALLPELANDGSTATREQMFAAVVDLLTATCKHEPPVAIAIDDAHWLDAASVELLHFVSRRLRDQPILFALTARSGELIDNQPLTQALRSLRKQRIVEDLELGPLTQDGCVALIANLSSEVDGAKLFEQSGGNPLFALELARCGNLDSTRHSRTIMDVVRERIERLDPAAADVLRWAAALAPTATVTRVATLIALPDDAFVSALEVLEQRALLTATGDDLSFAHGIVRSVVYADISEPRRKLMHGKIARCIDLSATGDETVAAELAHHAHLAGDAAAAVRACIVAGARSLRLFANRDAMALCDRGFRYLNELAEPERTILEIDLWSIRLGAEVSDDHEGVATTLETLGGRALDAGFEKPARRAFRMLGYIRWERGQTIDAARHMLNAARLTEGNDGLERAAALADAARCLVRLDRELGHAEALTVEARAIATKHHKRSPMLADAEGMLRCYEGAVDEAAELFAESARLARASQKRLLEFEAIENMVILFVVYGEAERAKVCCPRMLELGHRMREGSEGPTARAFTAIVEYCTGDGERHNVLSALEALRVADAKQRMAIVLLAMAAEEHNRGASKEAFALAHEALDYALVLQHRSLVAWARALCASTAGATGDTNTAADMRTALKADGTADLAAFAKRAATNVL